MKNRGFAVSAALYGMVILFVTVMFCLLSMFKDYRAMNKDFVGSVKKTLNFIEPTIETVIPTTQEEAALAWYPFLLKLEIKINNANDQEISRNIKILTPNDVAISGSVYRFDGSNIKIKSCNGSFSFGTTTPNAASTCVASNNLEYNFLSEPSVTNPTVHEDTTYFENNGAIPFTNNEYFEIGPVNLGPVDSNNGDTTFIFYFRTTSAYATFYDTDLASKITLTQ